MRHEVGTYYAGRIAATGRYGVVQCTHEGIGGHDWFALVTDEGAFSTMEEAQARAEMMNTTLRK